MLYFQVRYDSRVVIYERKIFIRLATGQLDSRVVNDDRPHLNMIGSNGPARL